MELASVLRVAVAAARAAVDVHRASLGRIGVEEWGEKGTHDFVTRVDRDAEAAAIEQIHRQFPDHDVLSEEEATAPLPEEAAGGAAQSRADPTARIARRLAEARARPGWLWVIDPLDGTTNYLHRYPMYCASVAGLEDGEPAVAAIVHGETGQTWTAVRGGGAFLDGERICVSAIGELNQALIGTGFPFKALDQLPDYLVQFERILRRSAGVRRAGSAALDLCHVASGYFDGFWELALAPWDIAAGTLIVREAGGIVTRLDGNDDVLGPGSVLAGNPRVHAALRRLLTEGVA